MTELPADQLTAREAAALAGIAASTWRDYVSKGIAPRRDGRLGNQTWWWRSTVEEWMANRPGRGYRTDLKNDSDGENTNHGQANE